MEILYKPIGVIHTPFSSKEGMPVQSSGAAGIKRTIELNEDLMDVLLDLGGFSHIYLIYHFHRSEGFKLQVIPFPDNKVHGVFATRAPMRPYQIGISVVTLIAIKNNILEFENADMLDGTQLLDIKPYIPAFDIHKCDMTGWMENSGKIPGQVKSDDRFE